MQDRICIVIGAAHGGIGFAFAKEACSKYGMRVALCDLDFERLQQRKLELESYHHNAMCCTIQVDISKAEQVLTLGKRACEMLQSNHVAIVMNAAAIFAEDSNPTNPNLDLWTLAYQINVLGAVHVNKMALSLFQSQDKGETHLLQVSSLSAFTGGTGEPYASSKLALVSLMENLYRFGVAHNKATTTSLHIVLPGVVNTQFATSSHRAKKKHSPPAAASTAVPPTASQAKELKEMMKMGLSPQQAAERIFAGMLNKQFYIVVDNDMPIDLQAVFTKRAEALLSGASAPPTFQAEVPIVLEAKRKALL